MSKKPLDPESSPSPPGNELLLPHEREESKRNVAETPDPVIKQAKRDVDAGLVDTDMRAIAGPNADLRERLVPGPGGKPPVMESSQNSEKKARAKKLRTEDLDRQSDRPKIRKTPKR